MTPEGQVRGRAFDGGRLATGLPLVAAGLGGVGLVWVAGQPGGAQTGHEIALLTAAVMALAMMGPLALPLCRSVARATMWQQAPRAVLTALLVFLGTWCVASVLLHYAAATLLTVTSFAMTVLLIVACCATLQLGRRRVAVLVACDQTEPIRPGRTVRDASRWSLIAAGRCVRACGTPMMLTAVQPSLVVVGLVTGMIISERVLGRPRLGPAYAATYAMLGLALVVAGNQELPLDHGGHH